MRAGMLALLSLIDEPLEGVSAFGTRSVSECIVESEKRILFKMGAFGGL